MRRQSPTLFIFPLLIAVLISFTSNFAAAQAGPPVVSGSGCLVVSRESEPTPSGQTAPSLSSVSVVSQQWIAIALANARVWALSFAPAPARHAPVAVRRRAVL